MLSRQKALSLTHLPSSLDHQGIEPYHCGNEAPKATPGLPYAEATRTGSVCDTTSVVWQLLRTVAGRSTLGAVLREPCWEGEVLI